MTTDASVREGLTEREQFEAWCERERRYSVTRIGDSYQPMVQQWWLAWQAGRAAQREQDAHIADKECSHNHSKIAAAIRKGEQ